MPEIFTVNADGELVIPDLKPGTHYIRDESVTTSNVLLVPVRYILPTDDEARFAMSEHGKLRALLVRDR